MNYYGIKTKFMENGVISIDPATISDKGKLISNYVHLNHKNRAIGDVEYYYSKNANIIDIENSYKNLIRKIHHVLNNFGYQTDSSGIDSFEIRIVNDKYISNKSFKIDYELASGIIINMILEWRTKYVINKEYIFVMDETLKHIFRNNSTIDIDRIATKGENIVATYSIISKPYSGGVDFFEHGLKYSKEKSKKIFKNIINSINNMCDEVNIDFLSTEKCELKLIFPDVNNMEIFENNLSNIIKQYQLILGTRKYFLDWWFNSPFLIRLGSSYKRFHLDLKAEGNLQKIIIHKTHMVHDNIIFSDIFSNLNQSDIKEIIDKYFIFDGTSIFFDTTITDEPNYAIEFSKIRLNIIKMMTELSKLNSSKSPNK